MPNVFVPIALIGWIFVAVLLFATLRPRIAVVAGLLGAWMFLPVYGYKFPGIPDYSKVSATSIGVVIGVALFDFRRISQLRCHWFDIPMLLWCAAPVASSIAVGYGIYDGLSGMATQVVTWGIPYAIGRMYFGDTSGLRLLTIGLVVAGLVYMPLCLWEVRMSPMLHKAVYGYHQHSFSQTKRFDGFRPMVFMQHGLAVGMFMCMSALAAMWLWIGGVQKIVGKVSVGWAVVGLGVTGVLCKSSGAIGLLACGMLVLGGAKIIRTPLVLLCVLIIPFAYIGARTVGGWNGSQLVEVVGGADAARAQSLQFRLNSENGVWAIIQSELVFGRARFHFLGTEGDVDISQRIIGDGLWLIAIGKYGLVGLAALMGVFVLGPVLLICRVPATSWHIGRLAPVAAIGSIVALSLIDGLFNAMINPVFIAAIGGLTGCCGAMRSDNAGSKIVQ